jgi:hypothetical protein
VNLEVSVTEPRVIRQDGLGRLELGIFLEEHGANAEAAEGWEGDRYVLVELEDGTRALGWYIVWEDDAARAHFVTAMQAVMPRLGADASLDSMEIGGRPATFLRVGRIGDVTARITDPGS